MTIAFIIAALAIGAVITFLLVRKKKKRISTPPPVVQAPASDWRPMLGVAQPEPVKRTPKYRIQLQSNGYDRVRPKQIEKTVEWLQNAGAGHLVQQFIAAANEVADMPKWIDAAYEKCAEQYRACGGKYAAFIATDDPSTIFVEIVATPMQRPDAPGKWAGAMAFPDKKTVRVVIMACGGMKDDPTTLTIESPATAHLALGKNYFPWEIANMVMLRYGYYPKRIPEDEWGDKGPPECR